MKKVLCFIMMFVCLCLCSKEIEQADLVGYAIIRSPVPKQNYILIVNYHDVMVDCVMKFDGIEGTYVFEVSPKGISSPIPVLEDEKFKFMCFKTETA